VRQVTQRSKGRRDRDRDRDGDREAAPPEATDVAELEGAEAADIEAFEAEAFEGNGEELLDVAAGSEEE
jgi:hypothetical protein